MKITVLAVGRLGRSIEADLARDYSRRASAGGRALGVGPVDLVEVEAKRSGEEQEAELLIAALPQGAFAIACDEHGAGRDSRAFAGDIARRRDEGERQLVFILGGADGLAPRVLTAARERLAFGPQTWPHALARVMLCEQIYRAVTILGGAPYHRD